MVMTKPAELLKEEIDQSLAGVGGQLYIEDCSGRATSLAYGCAYEGRGMAESDLANAWCATRPMMGLLIGVLHDEGVIDLQASISSYVPASSPLISCSQVALDLLSHRTGYVRPRAIEAQFLTPGERTKLVMREIGGTPGSGYSEVSNWTLLQALVFAVTGRHAAALIDELLVTPLGLEEEMMFFIPRRRLRTIEHRVVPYFHGLPLRGGAVYSDRGPTVACHGRAVAGGFVSMRALGSLYGQLGAVLRGESVRGLPSTRTIKLLLGSGTALEVDPVLGRPAAFAGGFMLDLSLHGIGTRCSEGSFGHSGLMGSSMGFIDPEEGVCASFFFNGLISSIGDMELVRSRIVNAIIDDCGFGCWDQT